MGRILNSYASTDRSSLPSEYTFESAVPESFGDVKYVSISRIQLAHSIVVPIMYSLMINELVKPVSP